VAPRKLRYVFVTATLPQQTAEELLVQWPDLALASGPGLHRTAAGKLALRPIDTCIRICLV